MNEESNGFLDDAETIEIVNPKTKEVATFVLKEDKKTKSKKYKRASEKEKAEVETERLVAPKVKSRLEQEIQNATDEIYKSINKNIKEIVFKSLGFENRWDKWEVDHCNGRMSALTEYVSETAKDLIKSIKADEVSKLITDDDKNKMLEAIKKDIISEVSFQKRQIAASISKNLIEVFQNEMTTTVMEILEKEKIAIKEAVIKEMNKLKNS